MNTERLPEDINTARHIVCLYLAQSGEPHIDLGYETQREAFDKIGEIFSRPATSIKLCRDYFDRHTDSSRVGWEGDLTGLRKIVFTKYGSLPRPQLLSLAKEILQTTWPSREAHATKPSSLQLGAKVQSQFKLPDFRITTETFETSWGVVNKGGRSFKLTNADIVIALSEILENWDEWERLKLNQNSINPDKTLVEFARNCFSQGAHQVVANDQRRSFLHLISAIVYTRYYNADFDKTASSKILPKDSYKCALDTMVQYSDDVSEKVSLIQENMSKAQEERLAGGENVIYYGAPGTGKSHRADELTKKHIVIRTVFHPDVQNSDFIGALKPAMDKDGVTYRFSPGPFSRALVEAMKNPGRMVSLVIEELNRAPAPAVFGELFLLLDRDKDGRGEYDTDFPSEEFGVWYKNEVGSGEEKIRIPSNLSIYATMNSADQGVYPLDTAFRRRWIQEYVALETEKAPYGLVQYPISTGVQTIEWKNFLKALNARLAALDHVQEDRLIGPWFIKPNEIPERDRVPEKLLIYLWDDLLRHEGREAVFRTDEINTYGELVARIRDNKQIFAESFLSAINAVAVADVGPEAEDGVEAEAEGEP